MRFEFSAGGIVVKKEADKKYVLVAQHSAHHGWVFPKGLIEAEKKVTKEEAALREVLEETGVTAKIVEPLTPATYWYVFEGEKIKKTVYYFVMEYVSGNITDHDFEMENVEWLPAADVAERLTYNSDKKAWKEAQDKILNSNI